jgi:hypothetical protein
LPSRTAALPLNPLDLGGIEADQVELESLVPQPCQLLGQQRVVPARLQGKSARRSGVTVATVSG